VDPGLDFYTVNPCRLVDTRQADGPALQASVVDRTFVVTGTCGIPITAKALAVNVGVASPAATGFLTLYPADQTAPNTSTINFSPDLVRTNNAIVVLATDGSGGLTVKNGSAGTVHFILDVFGYFE
jgi:hypothetical protein